MQTKDINGFRMAYTDEGQGSPLLLVHGYPLNRQMWAPQIDRLKDIHRIIAPDLRGHGDSQPVPGPYPMDLLADDLAALLDALHIDQPVTLCGLSMGGYVALAFYRKYAARLRALILTATRAAADTPSGRAGRDQAAEVAGREGVAAIVEGMLPKLLSAGTMKEKPELVGRVRQIMLRTSLAGVQGALMGMKVRPDSTALLPAIQVPTLILPGEEDQIIPLEEARAMYDAIPGAIIKIVADSGHLPNLENPDFFNRVLRSFSGM